MYMQMLSWLKKPGGASGHDFITVKQFNNGAFTEYVKLGISIIQNCRP